MKNILFSMAILISVSAGAQITKVNLQASGLTCSMCSNAIYKALKSVAFVDQVEANIKNSSFEISFKEGMMVDMDMLKGKVEGAGFFVARFLATVNFNNVKKLGENCVVLGNTAFHFRNAKDRVLNGEKIIRLLDKGFVSSKEYKKNGDVTKGDCSKQLDDKEMKLYHVTI